jgi:hypothetical protein
MTDTKSSATKSDHALENPMRPMLRAAGVKFIDATLNEKGQVVLRGDPGTFVADALEQNYQRRLRRAKVLLSIGFVALITAIAFAAR